MMKGFVTKGLVLLALGVLVAACAPPSEESSISSRDKGSIGGVPMVLDPANHKLTIGDGGNGVAFVTDDGHSVEVTNGASTAATCLNDGTGNSQCWIRLYNRDSNEYMANAFVNLVSCASCDLTNHIMNNFDAVNIDAGFFVNGTAVVSNGYTVHTPVVAGGNVPIISSPGVAYVTDTFNPEVPSWPHNAYGAPLMDLPTTKNVKPQWMLGPKCSYSSQMWDFGGTDLTLFPFYATVKATWFQFNPLGANGVIGGGDDDPRYDFNYLSTIYLTLTDLVSPATDSARRKMYRPGTVYRSNVLAGYKPTFARGVSGVSVADINFTGGQKYFAVNVGIEASNRMESMNFGLKSDPNFEYYNMVAIMTTWNPKVLTHMAHPSSTTWYLTKAVGGTRYQHKANSMCMSQDLCERAFNTDMALDLNFDPNATSVGGPAVGDRGGYVSTATFNTIFDLSGFWTYFNTSEYYSYWDYATETGTGPTIGPAGYREIPRQFFQRGFAKIRCMDANNATCIQQDGPDPDVDVWLYNFIVKVNPNTVGLGTEIKVDTFSDYTVLQYNTTNGTFDTSGATDNSTNAGPMSVDDNAAMSVYDGSTLIIGSTGDGEQLNRKIRHRGPAKVGSAQAWNVGVCIK